MRDRRNKTDFFVLVLKAETQDIVLTAQNSLCGPDQF